MERDPLLSYWLKEVEFELEWSLRDALRYIAEYGREGLPFPRENPYRKEHVRWS